MADLVTARGNRLLAHLPDHMLVGLLGSGDVVDFPSRASIQAAGERTGTLHFPLGGMLSVVTQDTSGTAVEVATIGREGMAGVTALFGAGPLPFEVMWQLPGRALVVELSAVRPLLTSDPMVAHVFGRYLGALMSQTGQNAGCNRMHGIDQRAAKWLLLCRDRVDEDTFGLTQEFFAIMLGVTRPKLSVVQASFQRAGFIAYTRGQMRVLDRAALEEQACACYRVIAAELAAMDPPD
jgi:CRP-like cAMP-binding protein